MYLDKNKYLAVSLLTAVTSIAVVLSLNALAGGSRRLSDKKGMIFRAKTTQDVYGKIKEGGGKGRHAVCFSLHSHSTALDDRKFIPYKPYSFSPVDLVSSFEGSIEGNNLLWVLMQDGVIRRLTYAVPADELKKITKKVTGRDLPPPIDVNYRGSPVLLYDLETFPVIEEPVILFIDGSVFSVISPTRLNDLLKEKRLTYDLVVLSDGINADEAGGRWGKEADEMADLQRVIP